MKKVWSIILILLLPITFLPGIASAVVVGQQNVSVDGPILFSTLTGVIDSDSIIEVGIDGTGDIYMLGTTRDTGDQDNPQNCVLYKINSTDFTLVYETVFGGTDWDNPTDMVVDVSGAVYVTGRTNSEDFPTLNGYFNVFQNVTDCFVTCFDTNGSIKFSTFIGGDDTDMGESIFVDDEGAIYVTGRTQSQNFPLLNSYCNRTRWQDVFVTKLNSSGNGLVYSSVVGAEEMDSGGAITVDEEGNAYVTGITMSENFPIVNAYSDSPNPMIPYESNEGFVFKLNSTGNGLLFSTFMGGTESDIFYDIELDSQGDVWVCGYTKSGDFPTIDSIQPNEDFQNSDYDPYCVIFELSSNGSVLLFSTIFGGQEYDVCYSMDFDERDNLYVTGSSGSEEFPLKRSLKARLSTSHSDAFVMKIGSDKSLMYSTLIGGTASASGSSIAVDANGAVVVGGFSASEDFPLKNAISDAAHDIDSHGDGFTLVLLDISDEDGDNIPNWWEIVHGYDPFDSNTPLFEILAWNIRSVVAISVFSIIAITAIWSDRDRIKSWKNGRTANPDTDVNE